MADPDSKPWVRIPLEGEAYSPGLYQKINGHPFPVMRRFSAEIDAEDEELVRTWGPWYVANRRGWDRQLYARSFTVDADLHDLIMGTSPGQVWAGDGDLLNCRKSNLRVKSKERAEREGEAWEAERFKRWNERWDQHNKEMEQDRYEANKLGIPVAEYRERNNIGRRRPGPFTPRHVK
jgi:hypothetical protein